MRIAILSDIHGNILAFNAVLDDIAQSNIDKVIYLGDYFGEFPNPNEVISYLKSSSDTIAVSGNKERYFEDRAEYEKGLWKYHHLNMLYWNYEEINEDNHRYISSLDATLDIMLNNKRIMMTHKIDDLITDELLREFSSSKYSTHKANGLIHDNYLDFVQSSFSSSKTIIDEVRLIDADIILAGHTHIQWHAFVDGKLILNPGSVGLPLDHQSNAAYTIVDLTDMVVIEKRVSYDIGEVVEALKASELYEKSRFWSDVAVQQLSNGQDEISFFFRYVASLKNEYVSKGIKPEINELYAESMKNWNDVKHEILPRR